MKKRQWEEHVIHLKRFANEPISKGADYNFFLFSYFAKPENYELGDVPIISIKLKMKAIDIPACVCAHTHSIVVCVCVSINLIWDQIWK